MAYTFDQPDFETQSGTAYKTAIDNSIGALSRIGKAFAAHEQAVPAMTVRVDAGALFVDGAVVEVAAQSTGVITAPVVNPRIDRVIIDAETGTVAVVTGDEAAVPEAPAITDGYLPICQVALAIDTTEITNDLITDERIPTAGTTSGDIPVNGGYINSGTDPAIERAYGTWSNVGRIGQEIEALLHFNGAGTSIVDSAIYPHKVTVYGAATQNSGTKKFGAASLACPGVGDYISIPYGWGAKSHTIDFWVYCNVTGGSGLLYATSNTRLFINASGVLYGAFLGGTAKTFTGSTVSSNTWTHIAVIWIGSNIYVAVNGTLNTSPAVIGVHQIPATLYIGGHTLELDGYIDELRIIDRPVYFDNFSAPTAAYPDPTYVWLRTA